jgi:methylated-DNA-[protein]-cysteine S-methyltransferase
MTNSRSATGPLLLHDRFDTPLGELIVICGEDGCLRAVHWNDRNERAADFVRRRYGAAEMEHRPDPGGASSALQAYFAGELTAIDHLPVRADGTPFQQAVWSALREIPAGRTMSYSTLAQRIGRPSAVRAVGLANGANPVGIVVPCHRVIGANGTLTGYGGGLDRKRWLLAHERAGEFELTG